MELLQMLSLLIDIFVSFLVSHDFKLENVLTKKRSRKNVLNLSPRQHFAHKNIYIF